MYFIAPAGSNVAYISKIFNKEKTPSKLAYHESGGQWTHDLDHSKIDDKCVKIFFPYDYQIIVLNWFYKIFMYPTGGMELAGLSSTIPFFTETMFCLSSFLAMWSTHSTGRYSTFFFPPFRKNFP